MGRKLSTLTLADAKKEMSLAGDPNKIVEVAEEINELIISGIDTNSIPQIENMQFALQIITAHLKHWERIQRDRQHP